MTRKPCPGCKKVDERRRADDVCHECRRRIAAGINAERQQSRKYGATYQMPHSAHALPYVSNVHRASLDTFRGAFFDLAVSLSVTPASVVHYTMEDLIPGTDNRYSVGGNVYLEVSDRDNLRAVYDSVLAMAKQAHLEGRRQGQNFIHGLCDGSVALDDLNKATIRADDEYDDA